MEQNRERTGIELPYEQAAMNKEPMPEGLEFPDQIMYQGLRYLYAYYKMGWISLPHCSIEKRYMLEEYRRNQFADACGKKHMRLALLCQKRFPIDFQISLMQSGQAFPLVVYAHKLEDNSRKIMDISECEILPDGSRKYNTLYRYTIDRNVHCGGQCMIQGHFEKVNSMSDSMRRKLMQFGVPQEELQRYLEPEVKE